MSDFYTRAVAAQAPARPARDNTPLDAWWAPRPTAPAQPPAQPPAPPAPAPIPEQAQSAKATARCPHCGDNNYFKATLNAATRCYGCGYVDGREMLHTTSGMVSTDRTPATPARQLRESSQGGYQPQKIIGRVS